MTIVLTPQRNSAPSGSPLTLQSPVRPRMSFLSLWISLLWTRHANGILLQAAVSGSSRSAPCGQDSTMLEQVPGSHRSATPRRMCVPYVRAVDSPLYTGAANSRRKTHRRDGRGRRPFLQTTSQQHRSVRSLDSSLAVAGEARVPFVAGIWSPLSGYPCFCYADRTK